MARPRKSPEELLGALYAPQDQTIRRLVQHRRGPTPTPHVTPHTLRRTFASILAECDVNPRRAISLTEVVEHLTRVVRMGPLVLSHNQQVQQLIIDLLRRGRRPAPLLDQGRAQISCQGRSKSGPSAPVEKWTTLSGSGDGLDGD